MAKLSFLKTPQSLLPTKSLRFRLHEHLSIYEPARPLGTLHASELTKPEGLCPRFYALADVTEFKPPKKFLSTSESVTYQIGRDMQDNIVNWLGDMGAVVGHWRCLACGKMHEFCNRPHKCENCGCRGFKPEEVRFVSEKTGASCGVDCLYKVSATSLKPIEIKTMDKEQFKGLVAPLAEHRLRTNFYLRIIAESGHHWSNLVDTKHATILYTTKGGYGCADPVLKGWGLRDQYSPFKDYEITRDDKATNAVADRARVVHEFRKGKHPMPHGLCATALSKRAQYCPLKKVCFSGDHPPVYDWGYKEKA